MPLMIDINKNYFIENIRNIGKISGSRVNPVLKLNAYGHGLAQILSIIINNLLEIDRICVTYTNEALKCIALGWKKQILVLGDSLHIIFHPQIEYFVLNPTMMQKIINLNTEKKSIHLHIKCNVGLNRFGFNENDLMLSNVFQKHHWINIVGIGTHLPRTDYVMTDEIAHQINLFEKMITILEDKIEKKILDKHIFGSKGINLIQKYNLKCSTVVRAGGSCYGLLTTKQKNILQKEYKNFSLKQIMTLKTSILDKKQTQQFDHSKDYYNYIGYGNVSAIKKKIHYVICDCGYGYGFFTPFDSKKSTPAGYYKNHYLRLCALVSMNNIFFKIPQKLYNKTIIGEYIILSSEETPQLLAADLSIGRPYMFTATLNDSISRSII